MPSFAKMMSSSVRIIRRGNHSVSDDTVCLSTTPDRSHVSSGGSFENALRTFFTADEADLLNVNEEAYDNL